MRPLTFVLACCTALLASSMAMAQQNPSPLLPPDRSSPRATLKLFLESADKVGDFIAGGYRQTPTRSGFAHLVELADPVVGCLDLSEVPPAARAKRGAAAALAIYETLSRIDLPPLETVPGKDDLKSLSGDPPRWVIPNTPIAIVRIASGPQSGDFVFSPHTVASAEEYYARTRDLPYVRAVPLRNSYETAVLGGGWLIPYTAIEAMPAWLQAPVAGESVWKWLALVIVLVLFLAVLRVAYRLSRRVGEDRPFLQSVARLALPFYVLVATPVVAYLVLLQINIRGEAGIIAQMIATAMIYLAGAWLSWRITDVIAEAIISSPRIKRQSIDAHLTRICTRLLGMAAAITLLVTGADRIGVPVYGVIAGLGVGGLAIALSAQPTIENLIGGLNIFADRPIRVGHLCKYGTDIGTVEEIGIRSTRIRGADRTVTTIPNGMLSKMSIVNMTERERMLIRTVITLPGDARDRVRYLLAAIEEMLHKHSMLHRETARARLTGFTGNSAEIEVVAYANTRDTDEFLTIQQDVLLHTMEIVEQSKSSSAPASPGTQAVPAANATNVVVARQYDEAAAKVEKNKPQR